MTRKAFLIWLVLLIAINIALWVAVSEKLPYLIVHHPTISLVVPLGVMYVGLAPAFWIMTRLRLKKSRRWVWYAHLPVALGLVAILLALLFYNLRYVFSYLGIKTGAAGYILTLVSLPVLAIGLGVLSFLLAIVIVIICLRPDRTENDQSS